MQRHDVPGAIAREHEHTAELALLDLALEGVAKQISTADRAVFFHDTPAEKREGELLARKKELTPGHATARAAADRTVAAAVNELPYLAPALASERIVRRCLTDPGVAVFAMGTRPAALELEKIADDITATWLPGVNLQAFRIAVARDANRQNVIGHGLDPLRGDPRLGWAPIGEEELFARAAALLGPEGCDTAHEASKAMDRQLLQERERLRAAGPPAHADFLRADAALRAHLAKGSRLAKDFDDAVIHSLRVMPPMQIAVAACTAAGALEGGGPDEQAFTPDGASMMATRTPRRRALLMAALAELRAAVEAVYPGVGTLLAGTPRDPGGPYRTRGSSDAAPSPLSAELERRGLGAARKEALRVALKTNLYHRLASSERKPPTPLDRWYALRGDADKRETYAKSFDASREELVRQLDALVGIASAARAGHLPRELREALTQAHVVLGPLGVSHSDVDGGRAAVRRLAACCGRACGVTQPGAAPEPAAAASPAGRVYAAALQLEARAAAMSASTQERSVAAGRLRDGMPGSYETSSYDVVSGRLETLEALRVVTMEIVRVFGRIPSDAEVLVEELTRPLL